MRDSATLGHRRAGTARGRRSPATGLYEVDHSQSETPGPILHARSQHHYWQGRGGLSIKSFVSGRALYKVDRGYIAVGPGEYLVLNDGQEYAVLVESAAPVESFCVFFPGGLAESVRRSLVEGTDALLDDPDPGSDTPVQFVQRTYPSDDLISPVLIRLRHDAADLSPGDGRLEESLYLLAARLLRIHDMNLREAESVPALRAATRQELYRRLHVARDYIAARYDRPISLEDIGRVAGLSANHLLRTFQALFGMTPHQYVIACRMERARALLARTDLPVTEICLAVGWTSLGTFSSQFRRRTGLSPRDYRRQFGEIREDFGGRDAGESTAIRPMR
ncbi:MAG TPA: AraC family transcriptional regulator [Chloroflexota bacterium]|nr:AraC family transcriptional regulator [Chloroflexota bacterium]